MELEDDLGASSQFYNSTLLNIQQDWNNIVVTSLVSLDSPSQASILDNAEREEFRMDECE
eukprot:scaffold101133_cov51-Attheya_sp.AAC.7